MNSGCVPTVSSQRFTRRAVISDPLSDRTCSGTPYFSMHAPNVSINVKTVHRRACTAKCSQGGCESILPNQLPWKSSTFEERPNFLGFTANQRVFFDLGTFLFASALTRRLMISDRILV